MGRSILKRLVCAVTLMALMATSVPSAFAQSAVPMPAPGTMVSLSAAFAPPLLKGVKVYPDNPLRLDFILDKGNSQDSTDQLKSESTRLIKYFLASITVPENDLWVNLSPYEKDRIVPDAFGVTEMGRDLLAQDYMLKQITASVIYPEGEVGKAFWGRVYAEAQKRFGTSDVPVDTFNKVWIVPEKAVVYESHDSAYVVESKLKVMLEEDYLALKNNTTATEQTTLTTHKLGSDIVREVVIPILEKEVNEGKHFAQLRQAYHSLILAIWYKDKIKESLLGNAYVDRKKTAGVDIDDKASKDKIWAQYVEAFRKGAYNFIKEDTDRATQQSVPRKYFSGGVTLMANFRENVYDHRRADRAASSDLVVLAHASAQNVIVQANLDAAGKTGPEVLSYHDIQDFLARHRAQSREVYDDFSSQSIGWIIKNETPRALEALEKIVTLRQWMDDHGAGDRPLIIWQNARLGEMYPFLGEKKSALRTALDIVEIDPQDVTAWGNEGSVFPNHIARAKYILVKYRSPSAILYRSAQHANFEISLERTAQKLRASVLMIDHSGRSLLSNAQEMVWTRVYHEVERLVHEQGDEAVRTEVLRRRVVLKEAEPLAGKEDLLGLPMFWAFLNPGNGQEHSSIDNIDEFLNTDNGPAVMIAGQLSTVSDLARNFYYRAILDAISSSESPILRDVRTRLLAISAKGISLTGDVEESVKGGIDLTRDKMGFQVLSEGPGIQFKYDPSMIQRLQNASGLTPIVIDIQPMTTSIPMFLGLKDDVPAGRQR